jgi:hypothetical protein
MNHFLTYRWQRGNNYFFGRINLFKKVLDEPTTETLCALLLGRINQFKKVLDEPTTETLRHLLLGIDNL